MIYVASRVSRAGMWRELRGSGWNITSTWIDEAQIGQTEDFSELWARVVTEIESSDALVLYARSEDFPLKGALVEVGIALGMHKRVFVCLPGVVLEPRNDRPVGSWIRHPSVTQIVELEDLQKGADLCLIV